MKADLHVHTHYSDGVDSPWVVIERAADLEFGVVGVADHDTVDGIAEALEAGRHHGIKILPGVEITSQCEGRELHLLAYFAPAATESAGWRQRELVEFLATYAQHRRNRAGQIVERLNTLGIPLTMEDVNRQVGKGTVGRPHIAAALLAHNLVSSADHAFDKYLKRGRAAWVDKPRPDAAEVIALVHRVGGVAVLGHPGLLRDGYFPSGLIREGLDGLEVYHSRHTTAQVAHLLGIARQHDLLVTGGSDCHGNLKGEPLLGLIEFNGKDLDRFLERLA